MVDTNETKHLLNNDNTNKHVTYNTHTHYIDVKPSISDTLYSNNNKQFTPTSTTSNNTINHELSNLLQLSVPVTVSYALEMFPLFITTGFIGRLESETAMSVNSLSNIVFSVVCMSVMYGSTSALDNVATIAFGQKDFVQLRKWLYIAIVCTATCCSVLAVPVYFFIEPILLTLGQDPKIVELTVPYVRILLMGLLPLIVFDCMKRWLQSQNKIAPVLTTTILCNITNIGLNYTLLYTEYWSITGISKDQLVLNGAIAVAFSNILLCVLICTIATIMQYCDRMKLRDMQLQGRQWSTEDNIDPEIELEKFSIITYCMQYMQLAVPSILQSMCEFITFDTLGLFAGILPNPERNLAAHAILFQTSVCSLILYYGITTSTAIKVGNAVGEHNAVKAKKTAETGLKIGITVASICGIILYILKNYIGRIYTNNQDVVNIVSNTMICLSFYQIFDCISNINHGLFRVTSMQKFSALFTIIGFGCVGIPAAYVTGIHYQYGLIGIWCSVSVGIALIATMSLLVFRHIDWNEVIENHEQEIDEKLEKY